MKNLIKLYKTKLCSLLWMLLGLEALVVIYLLTPAPIDPLIVIEPDFATLSGDNIIYEEGKPARYTVSVSKNLEKELHVTLSYGGGAIKGVDYKAPDTIVIKEGDMNATFEVTALDDNELEGEELISVKIIKIDGKNFMEPLRPQDLGGVVYTRILDEAKHQRKLHKPTLLAITCAKELAENNTSITCEVTTSQKSFEPIVVSLDFNGTAIKGIDYSATETLTIPANGKRASFKVTSIDDAYKEGVEEIQVSISSVEGGGYEESNVDHNVATIKLHDEKRSTQETQLTLNNIKKIEEGGSGTYTLALSRAPVGDVTVYIKRNESATKFNIPEKVVFHKGEMTKTFSIETVDDNIKEKTDFIDFSIARVEQDSFETLTYSNNAVKTKVMDEPVPMTPDSETAYLVLSTVNGVSSFDEGEGDVVIMVDATETVQTDTPITLALEVRSPQGRVHTLNKKLILRKDHKQAQTTLVLQDDNIKQEEEVLNVSIIKHGDGGLEDLRVKEAIALTLHDNSDGKLETKLTLDCSKRLYENAKQAKCRLTLSDVSKEDIVVHLTYSGDATIDKDYEAPAVITIPKGRKSVTFSITPKNDVIKEGEESIVIAMTSADQDYFEKLVLQENSATVMLTDEKKPSKIIYLTLKVEKSVTEGKKTQMTLALTQPALKDVVVSLNMPQSEDFEGVEKVVIPQGQQSITFDVPTINDNLVEQNEYVVASIVGVEQNGFEGLSFDKRKHRVLIVDDKDSANAARFSFNSETQKLHEDEKRLYINLILSEPTQQAMRVYIKSSGSATEKVDYTMPSSVVIKKGDTNTIIAIKPINDNIIETPESIVVTVDKSQTGGLEVIEVGQTYTVTLEDDINSSHSPVANISLSGPSKVSEGKTTANYTVKISQQAEEDVTLYLSYGGDATPNDYKRIEKVVIPKGKKSETFRLETIDNDTIEKLRTFTVDIAKREKGGLEHINVLDQVVKTSITDEVDIAKAFEDIVKDQVIKFDMGSVEITEDAKAPLNKIAKLFKEFPTARLTVEGHTNSIGSAQSNLNLSQQRADSIKRYLTSQGITAKRIKAIGYGESKPLLKDGSKEALEFNKRVEFRVVY